MNRYGIIYGGAAIAALFTALLLETPRGTLIESAAVWLLGILLATLIIELGSELYVYLLLTHWTKQDIYKISYVYAAVASFVTGASAFWLGNDLFIALVWAILGYATAFVFTVAKLWLLSAIGHRLRKGYVSDVSDETLWFDGTEPEQQDGDARGVATMRASGHDTPTAMSGTTH